MCIAAAAVPIIGLAISAVSTVASVTMGVMAQQQAAQQAQAQLNYQAQAQYEQLQMQQQQMSLQQRQQQEALVQQMRQASQDRQLQVDQANASIVNQYMQQRAQVLNERAQINARYVGELSSHFRALETAQRQVGLNNEAANRVYTAEQAKLDEARREAAFEYQNILAKEIGLKGSILASGRTGQSVGLLLNDVERQAGFATAQQSAMLSSKKEQAIIGMEQGWLQGQSANNAAFSNLPFKPDAPVLPQMPVAPQLVGLGITDIQKGGLLDV